MLQGQVERLHNTEPNEIKQEKGAPITWVQEWKTAIKRDKYLYLMAAPGLLFFLVFKYFPLWGLLLAFQNYSPYLGFWDSEWVGFKYFHEFFTNPDFMLLFRNTMAISLLNIVFFFPIPIIVALLLNEVRSLLFKKIVQTVVYLPHFLSWVIIVGICFLIFGQASGVINQLIVQFGGQKIEFLTDANFFWGMLTAQSIWKEAGWGTIIFLAALAGINSEQYEAAQIDGANRWQQMRNVTLPGIRGTIIVLLILRLGQVMDVGFEQIYLMSSGPVAHLADVFDTYAYRVGIQQGRFGYATVAGLFKSVVGLILVVTANRVAKKFGEEGLY
ncbi:ABC transporter permease [Paenibacillus aceris]|uniref:Aldouronate transport system permease protein n=1 Tax=Paenibacillus aceris TaxID=869555 RepID=A0ABS4I6J8_9BACL|nr:sugar ABC transporter permease [Paenibacillus aceris]MBP1966544.1 putative aldouronate transport system permease protein [Paenibacillus aceris]NHW39484.1 sugar ABC transporter permease [Paenibacillus aceris]